MRERQGYETSLEGRMHENATSMRALVGLESTGQIYKDAWPGFRNSTKRAMTAGVALTVTAPTTELLIENTERYKKETLHRLKTAIPKNSKRIATVEAIFAAVPDEITPENIGEKRPEIAEKIARAALAADRQETLTDDDRYPEHDELVQKLTPVFLRIAEKPVARGIGWYPPLEQPVRLEPYTPIPVEPSEQPSSTPAGTSLYIANEQTDSIIDRIDEDLGE